MPEIAPDMIVDDRYRIIDRVGSGGMADVYCAEDLQLGRRVALKLLHRRFAADREFVERFRREASSAAGLQHPNVVSVFDRGEWDGTYYIAMELLPGRTLKELIREQAPLDPVRAIDIALQILQAARFAHERGIIHRDLKPHNVMVDDRDHAKVTDFGIARAGASDMTQTGSIMGTAQYLSPEQAQGRPLDQRSDIYAIGIVLYEMLTGYLPFDGDSAVSVAMMQVSEQPAAPTSVNPSVPAELEAIVLWSLDKDPARRPQSADEMSAALYDVRQRIVAGELGRGPVYGPPPEEHAATEEGGGKRWPWIAGGLAVLAAIAVALLIWQPWAADKVRVPDVVGAQQAKATRTLEHRGFDVNVNQQRSQRPQGRVLSSRPDPGTKADKGSTVTLTVSSGPGQASVPSVDGLTEAEARKTLQQAGFKVRTRKQSSDSVSAGDAIGTVPDTGTLTAAGSQVTLIVSTGPETATVTNVVGSNVDDATTTLSNLGFNVQQNKQSSDKATGTVLAQDPAGGTSATVGSTVTLTVAQKQAPPPPEKISVPRVRGEQVANATSQIANAGLKSHTTEKDVVKPDRDGVVLSQSPGAGKKVDEGSTVELVVGRYRAQPTTPTTPTGPTGNTGPTGPTGTQGP